MHYTLSNFPGMGWTEPASRVVELARRCEAVGIGRLAIEDHRRHHDCFVLIGACLQATRTLVVESLVTDPYVRHPLLTARAFGTLSDLSAGRVILGLGGGLEQPAYWGAPREHPLQAVRETVDVCRQLWNGDVVTYRGDVVQLEEGRLDFAPVPTVPVLIAARGKRMLRLAGEIADIAHMASLFIDVEHQRDNIALIQQGAAGGRQPEIDLSVPLCIARDREKARRAARRTAAQGILWIAAAEEYSRDRKDWRRPPQFNVPENVITALAEGWDMWRQPQLPDELAALISDEVLDQFAVAGEPAECAERLSALVRELPEVTGVRFKLPPGTFEDYLETVELLGEVL